MAYTAVTVTDYNSNPPDDDGTISEANRGYWSTIKTKITDPLKTAIESVDSQLQTELAIHDGSFSTAVATTSGTSVTIDSAIPAWVTRITLMFKAVSTSGTDDWIVRLGDSGGLETTGYESVGVSVGSGTTNVGVTSGYIVNIATASDAVYGFVTLTKYDGNEWLLNGVMGSRGSGAQNITCSGYKSLSGTLTQMAITTTGGTDTFDAGAVRAFYE